MYYLRESKKNKKKMKIKIKMKCNTKKIKNQDFFLEKQKNNKRIFDIIIENTKKFCVNYCIRS